MKISEIDFDNLQKCPKCGKSPCEYFISKRCPETGLWESDSDSFNETRRDSCEDGHCDCYYDGYDCCDCGASGTSSYDDNGDD